LFCVNTVDKGVSGRIGVKAVDKGLTGGFDARRGSPEDSKEFIRKAGKDRRTGERKRGGAGDTVSQTLMGYYRIRYYLSSEKLTSVD
jgi:hypothetical protein